MTELRKEPDADFWGLVAADKVLTTLHQRSMFPRVVTAASKDADLVALYELRYLGETTAVTPKRASLIEELSLEEEGQLIGEIKAHYNLSETDLLRAIRKCEDVVRRERLCPEDIDWNIER